MPHVVPPVFNRRFDFDLDFDDLIQRYRQGQRARALPWRHGIARRVEKRRCPQGNGGY